MQLNNFYTTEPLRLEVFAGRDIRQCIQEAIEVARALSTAADLTTVVFDFNGVEVEVTKDSIGPLVHETWLSDFQQRARSNRND